MTIIITMAGLGTRFKKAGYKCPKYMIEAKGKTLFEWSMDSLVGYNDYVEKYIFVVRKEDDSRDFIQNKCKKYKIPKVEVIEIDYTTDGQATTCMLAIPNCDPDEPVMIYNIDTYVESYALKYDDISGEGYIPCFKSEGEHWSFVRLDEADHVTEVKEKERISDICTLGAYYFASANLYKELYKEYYSDTRYTDKGERYIAPLYNRMIENGMNVRISILDRMKVHVLGTPEELDMFLES